MSEPSTNLDAPALSVRPSAWWHPLTRRPPRGLLALFALGFLWGLLVFGYRATARPVRLTLNGTPFIVQTHQRTVGGLLREQGVTLRPEDLLIPSPTTLLDETVTLRLQLARRILLETDGRRDLIYSHAATIGELLDEQGLLLGTEDMLLLNGAPAERHTPLPQGIGWQRPEATITIVRAYPITIDDDGIVSTLLTQAETVGEALQREGIAIYEGDLLTPDPDTPLAPYLHVTIRRAKPVVATFDGRQVAYRTRAKRVGDVLDELGIEVRPLDRVEPPLDTPIIDNLAITVTRIDQELIVEREPIPFERQLIPDPNLELDTFEVRQVGAAGMRAREVLVIYENGEERERTLQREWVEKEPVDQIVAYGTNIVIRTLQTPDGPIQYWRRTPMLATSYTAASSGKPRDHPRYGITRTGLPAGYGIVAVDPRVVPLWTSVYVPGYGQACACDTGGGVIGAWIDLGYDEDNYVPWYQWVDVYWIAPPPPPDRIKYILPTAKIP